jgi:hypothetical protein
MDVQVANVSQSDDFPSSFLLNFTFSQVKTEMKFLDVKNLPEKVVKGILRYCDGKTLLKLSSTCKDFRKHVLESEEFVKKVNLVVDCANLNVSKVLALNCFAFDLKFASLKLKQLELIFVNADVRNGFLWLIKRLGETANLLWMEKTDISNEQLNEILNRLPNIRWIGMRNCKQTKELK